MTTRKDVDAFLETINDTLRKKGRAKQLSVEYENGKYQTYDDWDPDNVRRLSPTLRAGHMMIWLEAFYDGLTF